jgi:hypothetical protein
MKNNIQLVEELVPRIRPKEDGETTPEYLNHIFKTIEDSMFYKEGETAFSYINMERSPVFKIWKMSAKPDPFDLDDITNIFSWLKEIEKIQNSLKQRIGTKRKACFYITWKMYEEGKSFKEIYERTHAIEPYTNEPRDAIKNIKTLVKNFGWKRKLP